MCREVQDQSVCDAWYRRLLLLSGRVVAVFLPDDLTTDGFSTMRGVLSGVQSELMKMSGA